jgi:GlcNAc-P-P-Und epimerase
MVTGGAGFIGGALVSELVKQGFAVASLDRAPPLVVSGASVSYLCDILDRSHLTDCINQFGPDAIVHLAARTDLNGKLLSSYAANMEGVSNLVEAIRATPSVKRCMWTSTQLVCRVGYVPSHPRDYQPDTIYGQSKARGEDIVRASDGANREWCIVRPTTVWGPGMSSHYRRFLFLIKHGLYFHVDRGPLLKSYSYVGNIAHQYIRLLSAPAKIIQERTLYLADYSPLDLIAWCDAFQRAFGARPIPVIPKSVSRILALIGDTLERCGMKGPPFNSVRLRNMLTQYRFDLSETEVICGPLPYTEEDGVELTAAWFNSGQMPD